MLGSEMLDVAIGMTFIYLLLRPGMLCGERIDERSAKRRRQRP